MVSGRTRVVVMVMRGRGGRATMVTQHVQHVTKVMRGLMRRETGRGGSGGLVVAELQSRGLAVALGPVGPHAGRACGR